MNRQQSHDLISEILEFPGTGELQVSIRGEHRLGTRFNDCAVSQNAMKSQYTLSLSARLEQKKTTLSINQLDDKDLIKRSIDQVFSTCEHMPDDEEVMPAIGTVLEGKEYAFSAESEAIEIETIGEWTAAVCREGAAAGIDLAGLLVLGKNFSAYGDSAGGFAYERYHHSDFHVTATGRTGSGWAEDRGITIQADDVMTATRRAIEKCAMAQNPVVYQPRPTTVILEPQAVGDLIAMAFWYGFDQRALDEGRSAFTNYHESLGKLSLYSDPASLEFPTISFSADGQPLGKSIWLDQGSLQQLSTSRYWARKNNLDPKPSPKNIILSGEGTAMDNLIRNTGDGILVTRFWYIRSTDAATLGFTGMTRDGTYRIENGEITHPVVDMRWNESVLKLLKNVVASGRPGATGEFFPMVMPALKIENFNFSSLSD